MGFFKSTKQPQGPLPVVILQLNSQQDKVFKPNDTISGTVTLSTPIPINPQALEVSLWGESRTWIRTSSSSNNNKNIDYQHYRDHAPLFTVTLNVLPNSQKVSPDQSYTYPFQFRVPEGTSYNRNDCYKNPNDERWTALPHHLPPTFFYGTKPDIPDNASISYGVTSRLICPGVGVGKHLDPVSSTANVIFQPLNPHINLQAPGAPLSVVPFTKRFTFQSSALTAPDPSTIGFRQRISDRFSSATPKLTFDLGIEIPDLLTTGSEFRFRTTFTAIERTTSADKPIQIPPISFKIDKLELLDFTFFRGSRDWNAMSNMAGDPWKGRNYVPKPGSSRHLQEYTRYRELKTRLNSIPTEQVVQLPEVEARNLVSGDEKKRMKVQQGDYCEHWFTARVPGFTPPSFTSFAITRLYRVKVKMRVDVGDKKFEYEAESHVRHLGGL